MGVTLRSCFRTAAWVCGVVALLGGAGWLLASLSPSEWIDPQILREDPESDRRGRELEQNLAAEISKIRPAGEPWSIRIHDVDINAWIARRLPQWTEHDPSLAWPIAGATAQVQFDADGATISIAKNDRIWSGSFDVLVEADGVRLVPGWGAVGILPVPDGAWLASRFLEGNGAETLFFPNVFKLGDGRQVELRQIDFVPGAVEIEFITR